MNNQLFKYAQIDGMGKCTSVSHLSGEVIAENMKLLGEIDNVNPGDTWDGTIWIPAPLPTPLDPKQVKIEELSAACNATILAGFTSSALGSPHTYAFDYEAQTNIGGIYSAILGGVITTPQNWRASGVPTPHTVDQLKTLFVDGLVHKNTNIGRYQTLEAQVNAATTQAELDAIIW